MKIKLLVLLGILALAGCADESDACRTVSDMGFDHCTVTDSHYIAPGFYGCHGDDSVAFEVRALNPAHRQVNVVVCCAHGPFGACTVRNR